MHALALRFAGIDLATFGHLTAEDVDDEEEFTVARETAELAVGTLVWSIDEFFLHIEALGNGPSVARCDDAFFHLGGLSAQFAHFYTPLFARKLLVAAVELTGCLCQPDLRQLNMLLRNSCFGFFWTRPK